jgi:hypothetical protein
MLDKVKTRMIESVGPSKVFYSDENGDIQEISLGTAGQVFTSNSLSAAPSFEDAVGGLEHITETLHTTSPNNTVNAEQLEVTGGTTGALIAGGEPETGVRNKAGSQAVDLQLKRSAATQVASGATATIGGGDRNTASAIYSTVPGGVLNTASAEAAVVGGGQVNTASGTDSTISGGNTNTASAIRATVSGGGENVASSGSATVTGGFQNTASAGFARVGGYQGLADREGLDVWAVGQFSNKGDAQIFQVPLTAKTTTNSAVELKAYQTTRLTVPSGKAFSAEVSIIGIKSDGTAVARYLRQVTIKNVAGTTALVGSVITLGTDEAASTSISITADDTNDALKIEATGITSETWRWVAKVSAVEVAYGN